MVQQPRDLLEDFDVVLGDETAPAADVLPVLREYAPRLAAQPRRPQAQVIRDRL